MEIIDLSNHPEQMLRKLEAKHQAQVNAIQRQHRQQLAQHAAELGASIAERDAARAERRWIRWVGKSIAVRSTRARTPVEPPPPPIDERRVGILKAGIDAEARVVDELADRLGDDWTLLCGYRNPRGEIDLILTGPHGIVAIEVKNRNAHVLVDGDDWSFQKYDRWDNPCERGRFVDGGGRSPSRQLNEPADMLTAFLKRF